MPWVGAKQSILLPLRAGAAQHQLALRILGQQHSRREVVRRGAADNQRDLLPRGLGCDAPEAARVDSLAVVFPVALGQKVDKALTGDTREIRLELKAELRWRLLPSHERSDRRGRRSQSQGDPRSSELCGGHEGMHRPIRRLAGYEDDTYERENVRPSHCRPPNSRWSAEHPQYPDQCIWISAGLRIWISIAKTPGFQNRMPLKGRGVKGFDLVGVGMGRLAV